MVMVHAVQNCARAPPAPRIFGEAVGRPLSVHGRRRRKRALDEGPEELAAVGVAVEVWARVERLPTWLLRVVHADRLEVADASPEAMAAPRATSNMTAELTEDTPSPSISAACLSA